MKSKRAFIILMLMLMASLCFAFCHTEVKEVQPEISSPFHSLDYYPPARP